VRSRVGSVLNLQNTKVATRDYEKRLKNVCVWGEGIAIYSHTYIHTRMCMLKNKYMRIITRFENRSMTDESPINTFTSSQCDPN
jgi:hypothetical protein